METIEIGQQYPEAACSWANPAPSSVRSRHLGTETFASAVGASDGNAVFARSFADSRRLVAVCGASSDARRSISALLDELTGKLSAAEVRSAIQQVLARLAKTRSPAEFDRMSVNVLKVCSNGQVAWAAAGRQGLLLRRYARPLFATKACEPVAPDETADGAARFYRNGDAIVCWTGSGIVKPLLQQAMQNAPDTGYDRPPLAQAHLASGAFAALTKCAPEAEGCLIVVERFRDGVWRKISWKWGAS